MRLLLAGKTSTLGRGQLAHCTLLLDGIGSVAIQRGRFRAEFGGFLGLCRRVVLSAKSSRALREPAYLQIHIVLSGSYGRRELRLPLRRSDSAEGDRGASVSAPFFWSWFSSSGWCFFFLTEKPKIGRAHV